MRLQIPRADLGAHALPREAFRLKMRLLGGVPMRIIDDAEAFEVFEGMLRADLEISNTYNRGT